MMRVVHPVANQTPTRRPPRARHLATDTPYDLNDYITALCDATIHLEAFQILLRNRDGSSTWVTQRHRTTNPSLLEQLWSTVVASNSTESGVRAFASKPAARIDSIDVANDIDREAFDWLTRLGRRPDSMTDTIAAVRLIGALARSQDDQMQRDILHDVRSWWIRARVLTGWDSPAWRPDNTCPLCGAKGGLRVRLEARTATCVECREAWDAGSIGLLADHIRAENHDDGDDDGDTHETGVA